MVDALDAAAGAGMVGAGGNVVDAEALVGGARMFGAELEPIVGKESKGSSPERDVAVDEDVGRAGSGQPNLSIGVHVGSAAETAGEKEVMWAFPRGVMGSGPK